MTHSIQNSKSILAKALAQENIRVEHIPTAVTATFDVVSRTLTLPVWKDMSDEMYDLLVGHEVGHALYTPDHDKITNKENASSGPWIYEAERIGGNVHASYVQAIFNVVEDVRIERMVKEKYPGLRRDFSIGYRQMFERNFFGTDGVDVNKMSLADRLNLYFKVGVHTNIVFTDEEMKFVEAIESVRSFDDMLKVSEDLYKYISGKNENASMQEMKTAPVPVAGMESGDGDSSDAAGQVSVEVATDPQKNDSGNSATADGGKSEEKTQVTGVQNTAGPKGGQGLSFGKSPLPKITTQDAFEKKNADSVDTRIDSVSYTTLPIPDTSKMIYPHKSVAEDMAAFYAKYTALDTNRYKKVFDNIEKKYQDLLANTRPLIANLVQQFEMKKAADVQKRTSVSRSGRIDCDRIFKYKVSDDIFARYATIADGKNHGMVMFIDWSSSMSPITQDVLTQVVMLCQFCRKMGIPFEVYLFSSQYTILCKQYGIQKDEYGHLKDSNEYKKFKTMWKPGTAKSIYRDLYSSNRTSGDSIQRTEEGELFGDNFALIQVMSSSMTAKQFNDGLYNLFTLGQLTTSPSDIYSGGGGRVYLPNDYNQGNTPLDATVIAAMDIVPKFQAQHKVQIVNTIFLTDGESGWSPFYINNYRAKTIVTSPINKKTYDVSDSVTSTDALLRIFRDVTGSNTIGFFITQRQSCRYFDGNTPDETKQCAKELKEKGFYDAPAMRVCPRNTRNPKIENHGYDRLFVLPSNTEVAENVGDALGRIGNDASFARIRNAFFKATEKRAASRGFINRFADVIAAPIKR